MGRFINDEEQVLRKERSPEGHEGAAEVGGSHRQSQENRELTGEFPMPEALEGQLPQGSCRGV